jgi:transposase InsO family protein
MVRRRRPPSQTWKTFLENHVKSMVSVDFLAVPTIRFQILYVFLVLAHARRRIVHFPVTAHPTAEGTAQPLREAFPWDTAPRYLLRDRDRVFGKDFVDQVKAMGIKQVLSAPRSPWQRAYVERVVGTIRQECLDPMIAFGEGSLYRHLQKLHQLLSPEPDALGIGEGQPGAPAGPTARRWTDHRDSGGGWAPSSLRAARRLNGKLSSYQQRPSSLRQAPVSNPAWPRTVCPPVRLSAVKTIAALNQLPLELVPNRGEPIPENDTIDPPAASAWVARPDRASAYRRRCSRPPARCPYPAPGAGAGGSSPSRYRLCGGCEASPDGSSHR